MKNSRLVRSLSSRSGFGDLVTELILMGYRNYICTSPISESRLFYLVYVMVDLVEELVIEGDIEEGCRLNPE
jgi:hypothetical protein